MLNRLKQLLGGTVRRQLIVGMTLVVILVMSLFASDLTHKQIVAKQDLLSDQAISLAKSVSASAAIWVASRDLSGLQEIVMSTSAYPDLLHSIVLDLKGKVLAHNDPGRRGLYLTDLPPKAELQVMQRTTQMIDVASPIMLGDQHIGWVRIGLSGDALVAEIDQIWRQGAWYALIGAVVSILIASIVGRYLTRRLDAIQRVAEGVTRGDSSLRVDISGNDEAAQLSRQFNSMLDRLAQRDRALNESKALTEAIVENVPLMIFLKEATDLKFVVLNRAGEELLGYDRKDLLGKNDQDLFPPEQAAIFTTQDRAVLDRHVAMLDIPEDPILTAGKGLRLLHTRKVCIKGEDGKTKYLLGISEDITERMQAEAQIHALAFSDPLTGLPNRRLLMDRLEQAMVGAQRHKHQDALLFIDMDDFKTLNDSLGHDLGDQLLQQIAERLLSSVREGDTVARLGGDEFLVLLEDLDESAHEAAMQAETVARKIHHALRQIYQLASHSYHSSASIGITLFGGLRREKTEEPLKRAELAMYKAKDDGRDNLRFYESDMSNAINSRATLEADLHRAVARSEFLLYYQAQVDHNAYPTGVEALVRWQHPKRGLVSPAEFIPVAESSGLILPLGHWVLHTACQQLATWALRPEMAHLTMAVNVSARQFRWPDFVEEVLAVLEATGANPSRLKLELTESLLLDNMKDVITKMAALKAIGVKFSLDDFGTGYSSLAYLKRLPLDQLKIDQGFVCDILTDPNDAAIAKMVIALAESMGLNVIAEGVETQAQRDALDGMGCHSFQGYLFARPLPIEEFEAFAQTHFK